MLNELIDKIDVSPELMMNLAEQLGNLTEFLGEPEKVTCLLKPLEIMLGHDDPTVREKAVQSMKKVGFAMSIQSIYQQYWPILEQLSQGDYFAMRISSAFLFGYIYKKVDKDHQTKALEALSTLSGDDTPMVRRGAAQSYGVACGYIKEAGGDIIDSEVLPTILKLLRDDNDSVKIAAVVSSVELVKNIRDQALAADQLLPLFLEISEKKSSWRLRFTVAEKTSEIVSNINGLGKDIAL